MSSSLTDDFHLVVHPPLGSQRDSRRNRGLRHKKSATPLPAHRGWFKNWPVVWSKASLGCMHGGWCKQCSLSCWMGIWKDLATGVDWSHLCYNHEGKVWFPSRANPREDSQKMHPGHRVGALDQTISRAWDIVQDICNHTHHINTEIGVAAV